MKRDAEVIVVGGGPAGAAVATWLARAGHDVLLLDKTRFPREKPCGEYLSPGVVDACTRLGVLERLQAASPAWLIGMRVSTRGVTTLLDYTAQAEPREALGIPRPVFDQILLEQARQAGARVWEGCAVRRILVEDGRVVGVVTGEWTSSRELRARFVVGADGRHSMVVRQLGLAWPVRWPHRTGLMARFEGSAESPRQGAMHVGRDGYCGIAPVGKGLLTVGLVVRHPPERSGQQIEAWYEQQVAAIPGAVATLQGARRCTPVRGVGPLAARVRRVAGPGYLLVGDAAGFLDPFTGEGVYRALRGAELAATAVSEALRADRVEADGYEHARRQAFGDKERVCLVVQALLGAPPLFERTLRRLHDTPRLAATLAGVLGDYHPAGAALRLPYLWSLLGP